MLVDGEWQTDIEPYTLADGAFDRVETSFRETVRVDPDARFLSGVNSHACRTKALRASTVTSGDLECCRTLGAHSVGIAGL